MKFVDLKSNLQKEIKNLYVVGGNDSFLINQAIEIFKEKLVDALEEFNFQKVDASTLTDNDFVNLFATLPICSQYKLIVLENVSQNNTKAIDNFFKQPFYNVVVVIKSYLYKQGEQVDCDYLDRKDLAKWIENYLKKYDLSIDATAINYILEISNSDLGYISNELVKVVGYLDKGSKVSVEDIKLLFTKKESYFVYNLTATIDSKDKKKAFLILNSLQEDNNVGDIFTFMGSYFRKMFYVAVNTGRNEELATILKTKPYAIQKARDSINKNGKSFYINLYEKYTNLDYEIKSGKITPLNAIYSLIM